MPYLALLGALSRIQIARMGQHVTGWVWTRVGYFAKSVPIHRLTDRSPRSRKFRARVTSPSVPWRLATSFKPQVLNVER